MLPGNSRSTWDSHILDDPRVVSYWDGGRIAGKWFADNGLGGLGSPGSIVWDAYYAFPKQTHWNALSAGLVAAGSDIIDNTGHLEHNFIPLLPS